MYQHMASHVYPLNFPKYSPNLQETIAQRLNNEDYYQHTCMSQKNLCPFQLSNTVGRRVMIQAYVLFIYYNMLASHLIVLRS